MSQDEARQLFSQASVLSQNGQLDEAIEIYKLVKREDSKELFAAAQFCLGVILKNQGRLEQAIAVYQAIQRDDSAETFAKAYVNLGGILKEQGKLEQAIAVYQAIQREDSAEAFARAYVNLGRILKDQGKLEQAIAVYQAIQREDSAEAFAKAYVSLGRILKEQGKLEQAIAVYQAIQREDSTEVFAEAQFNLGILWKNKRKLKEAIISYLEIKREDSVQLFAKAQINLGVLYGECGLLEQEVSAYQSVRREDSAEVFAQAQWNLAVFWEKQGKLHQAIEASQCIKREDSVEMYARAQLNLNFLWKELGDVEQAMVACRSIRREDSPEIFAHAQFYLGIFWEKKEKFKHAIAAYQSVLREDSAEVFSYAQWNLGAIWRRKSSFNRAISAFQNIKYEDAPNIYLNVTEMLINGFFPVLIDRGTSKDNKLIKEILERVNFDYRHDILKFIFKSKDIHLLKILDCVTEILNELKIENLASEDFEKNIAHYTRPLIGFSLLNPTDEQRSSKFRLSTIKGVNDPTEGTILKDFLNYGKKTEDDLITFISCFTFNHDSLNQFRLYGKEKGQEASGISLVFERDKFFNQEVSAFNTLSHQNVSFKDEAFLDNKKIDGKQEESNKSNPLLVSTLPLYRCIYLESYSDDKPFYLQLAQREELTFYREDEMSKPSTRWKKYKKQIEQIEKNVKDKLTEIKEEISKLSLDEKIREILEKILLPLRYLVKHSAFKEEQECRIIYIANICDNKIQMNPEQGQMYVEYEPEVKKAIHKIYLSPGSEKYKDHFRKLLNDEKGNMVMSSTNPFRVKSS